MFLPSKHRKPHAWIREQRSKSAHLQDPTHAGTKYPRSGEPLTPTEPPTPCFYRQRPGRHVAAVATGHGMMGTDTVTVPPTATVTVTDTVTVQPTVTLTGTDTVTAQPTATATATQVIGPGSADRSEGRGMETPPLPHPAHQSNDVIPSMSRQE